MCGMRRTIEYLNTITTLDPINTELLAADLCGIFTPEAIEKLNPATIRAMHQSHYSMAYLTQINLGVMAVAKTTIGKQVH